MSDDKHDEHPDGSVSRYRRQIVFAAFGSAGQRALSTAAAVIIGVGGLGSWTAELLARAGVGRLRLVDDDSVDLTNIHRQGLYDEAAARSGQAKVAAAAARIAQINSDVAVEPVSARFDSDNAEVLVDGMDVIIDGTDNFASRFLINDVAVKLARPWVMAGVIGAEAQTMTIDVGRTPCLRCIMDVPPPPCTEANCRSFGVLGPAVATIASIQACEAMKILAGRPDLISPYLLKLNLWTNSLQRIDTRNAADAADCICCKHREFEFLCP